MTCLCPTTVAVGLWRGLSFRHLLDYLLRLREPPSSVLPQETTALICTIVTTPAPLTLASAVRFPERTACWWHKSSPFMCGAMPVRPCQDSSDRCPIKSHLARVSPLSGWPCGFSVSEPSDMSPQGSHLVCSCCVIRTISDLEAQLLTILECLGFLPHCSPPLSGAQKTMDEHGKRPHLMNLMD